MKSLLYISFLCIISLSCQKVLNEPPLNKISTDVVWNSEVMTRAYVTNLYSRINFYGLDQPGQFSWTDEATSPNGNQNNITIGTVSKTSEGSPYWDYTFIRDCTSFLQNIENSQITDSVKNQLSGEVLVMRAFAYFEMMKRYGGVPLVDVVIDPYKPVEDKYATRAKEIDIANFIDSQLTTAESLLTSDPNPKGRINKWTALALQARAMLWAASIAKYGAVQLDGIVGIPSSEANSFYAKASTAAGLVINSHNYALYNAIPDDKSENYRNIFMDKGNSEVIFEKAYDGVNVASNFDALCAPTVFANRGAMVDPTVEFILGYENVDGSADQPVFDGSSLYTNGAAIFANKDPRLFGTVFFQGDKWSIGTIESYDGLDTSAVPDFSAAIRNPLTSYQGIRTVGQQSMLPPNSNNTASGFTIKKYIDGSKYQIGENQSKTNWIAFRLAEMYLIKAEAEFEMGGDMTAAVEALNMTRSRAGISLVDVNTISLDKIRTERRSELSFEGHRYWDLRRWRIAQSVLNNVQFHGLHIILHYNSKEYYFLPFNCETFTRVFLQQHYYNPITTSRINNNPKLIENPLY